MIVFLISNYKGINTGRGGHYYSLLQMAQQVKAVKKVLIISIGEEQPAIYKSIDFAFHINSTLARMYLTVRKIDQLIEEEGNEEVEVIHGYDEYTSYYVNLLGRKKNAKPVITKCGGVTKKNYPKVKNLIVFHKKDFDFYKNKSGWGNVFLIPNRVDAIKNNSKRLPQINAIYTPEYFHIVKVGRIGRYYEFTLKQSIRLAALLSKQKKVKLSFVGYLESRECLVELKEFADLKKVELEFFTGDEFTRNAAELICGADLVVGTGRGAMEALSLGKILFAPVQGRELPALFDQNTSTFIMDNNFSERTVIPKNLDCYFDEACILEKLGDERAVKNYQDYGRQIFSEWYSIDTGLSKLLNVYEEINKDGYKNNVYLLVRYFYLSIKLYIKNIGSRLK